MNNSQVKRIGGICYPCGENGHMSRDCWSKKEMEDEWDAEAICVRGEDELELRVIMGKHIDYEMIDH